MSACLAALAMTFMLAQASDSAIPTPDDSTAPVLTIKQSPGWQRYVPVAASVVVPGSGQLIQGAWLKGFLHLGVGAACLAATQVGSTQSDGTLKLVGGIGLIGIGLWSPWDAYLQVQQSAEAPAQ